MTSQVEPAEMVTIDFPFLAPDKHLQARVSYWVPVKIEDGQPSDNEDIAILEIESEINVNCQAANLLPIDDWHKIRFDSFGFPVDRNGYQLRNGMPAEGITFDKIINGCVVIIPTNDNNSGYIVQKGYSGAPIWNNESVIGMVVKVDEQARIAYILPSTVLMEACFRKIARLETQLSKNLVGLLKDVSSQDWRSVYLNFSDDKISSQPANIYLAVLGLLRFYDQKNGFQFIYSLGNRFNYQPLIEWVEKHFKGQIRQCELNSPQNKTKNKLICYVEPTASCEETFYLEIWFFDGTDFRVVQQNDAPQKIETIFAEIRRIVNVAHSQFSKTLVIELVLPRNEFSHNIAQWKMLNGISSLMGLVPVFLRCQKRFKERRDQLRDGSPFNTMIRMINNRQNSEIKFDSWMEYSLAIKNSANSQANQKMFLLDPQYSRSYLDNELQNNKKGVFVVCGFNPQIAQTSSVLHIALDYGVPLAIWFRELPIGVQYNRVELLEILGLDDGVTLDKLPLHVWELQSHAIIYDQRENPLYHLSILYDDYESVPKP
jgi:hypothetical protein